MDISKHSISNKQYFPALTGVRALAAYLVYFYHTGTSLFHEGHVGVSIFFVLSGFLISVRYLDQIRLTRHWLGAYFRNRFFRIYPLYFLVTAATFLLLAAGVGRASGDRWDTVYTATDKVVVPLLNFTLLRGFFDLHKFSGVAAGWSLTLEETFYLLAPLLLLGLLHTRQRYLLLVGYAAALTGLGLALVALLPHPAGLFASYRFLFDFTFFGRCVEFLVGMALALWVRRPATPFSSSSAATWLGLAWIIGCMWLLGRVDDPLDGVAGTVSRLGIGVNNMVLPVGVAALFYGLIYERSWLRWLLSTELFDVLGKSSYAFYLVHQGVFNLLLVRHVTQSIGWRFVLLVGFSILLYYCVEKPLHRFGKSSS